MILNMLHLTEDNLTVVASLCSKDDIAISLYNKSLLANKSR